MTAETVMNAYLTTAIFVAVVIFAIASSDRRPRQ